MREAVQFELVLPCYNESRSIAELVEKTKASIEKLGIDRSLFRLVLVNNGSSDNTQDVMKELMKEPDISSWVKIVEVKKNKGYGFGIWSGLMQTSAPIIGWAHADLQTDTEDALKSFSLLLDPENSKLIIKGNRRGRDPKEVFVSRVFEFIVRFVLRFNIKEINAQPKIFNRDLLCVLDNPPNGFDFDLYVLFTAAKNGYQFKEIDVLFPERKHGVSHWANNPFKRYKTIWAMIKYIFQLRRVKGSL